MNSEVSQALKVLGYDNDDKLPTLKEVRKEFFRCARTNHPDKNTDMDDKSKEEREEEFKSILNAYNIVAEAIIESDSHNTENDEDMDEDEEYETEDQGYDEIEFEKEEFKEVYVFSTNTRSVTIRIPTVHADARIDVLTEKIGIKCYVVVSTSAHLTVIGWPFSCMLSIRFYSPLYPGSSS